MSALSLPLLAGIGLLLSILLRYVSSQRKWDARRQGRPLPPGPKSLPFIGNISLMRQPELCRSYRTLCDTYGDMVYVPVLGRSIVILGSPHAIFELLDKRSAVTSDRPQSPLVSLVGQESNVSLIPYGQWWRRHRRALWQHFHPATTVTHMQHQREAAMMFLRKLLSEPESLCDHIRYTFSAAIIKTTYGVDVADDNDESIQLLESGLEGAQAFTPGKYLVELLPFLQYIPSWVPGAGFQRQFAKWRDDTYRLRDTLFEKTKEQMDEQSSHSVVARLLEPLQGKEVQDVLEQEAVIKAVALTTCEAGGDTTFSTLQVFFIAMALNPDIQRKAQAELDAVIGPDRLPDHNDRASLPYIDAIAKESLRWQNVVPFSLPHLSTEDIEYNGYFIPAGTTFIANTWACLHDPKTYPDPESFNPDRFLRDDKLVPNVCDPARFAFGYGRRICPGRYYADASLFVNVAMVLHVFGISPPLDKDGREIKIEPKMTNGILSYPVDCRCTVTPRSQSAKNLILSHHIATGTTYLKR
ncbi:CyP450 monooxygenase [Earliella scabrosa]|nr:CyP450 monooxygenase [Earliella scabrosa]